MSSFKLIPPYNSSWWHLIVNELADALSGGDLPDPGIEPRSPALQADALLSELVGKPYIPYFGQYSSLFYGSLFYA